MDNSHISQDENADQMKDDPSFFQIPEYLTQNNKSPDKDEKDLNKNNSKTQKNDDKKNVADDYSTIPDSIRNSFKKIIIHLHGGGFISMSSSYHQGKITSLPS